MMKQEEGTCLIPDDNEITKTKNAEVFLDAGHNKFKRMSLDAYNSMMLEKAQRNGRVRYPLESTPKDQSENFPQSDNKKACILSAEV